ncbi:hypothetical protein BSL78_16775 [Apostichopus japonicus]|uniref:Endonuclease/exonuclease/phosphatase domain-containing protein n=1 Tax=Stichopus japonicus TaxID=307972 RepID=A0A2G8KED1_STIJA|nr:hypothetical protein BSL78_16775 [Apostichopus japonicus]
MDISVSSSGQQPLRLLSVYRPPSSKSKQTPSTFFREFAILLETISVVQCRLLFAGDFNFSSGLRQHVTGATHKKGHTLDLIISHETDSLVSNLILYGHPSDHYAVKCDLEVARPKPTKCTVRQRRLKDVDLDALRHDVVNSPLILNPADDPDVLIEQYHTVLSDVLDKHAPVKTRKITLRPHAPWYDESLRNAKRKKRSYERKWKSSGLEVDKQAFQESCSEFKELLDSTKTKYHRSVISECDQKQLFNVIPSLKLHQCYLQECLLQT